MLAIVSYNYSGNMSAHFLYVTENGLVDWEYTTRLDQLCWHNFRITEIDLSGTSTENNSGIVDFKLHISRCG